MEVKRVLIGMSGGVDSSASAILLKEQGYEVVGITLKLCELDNPKAVEDAKNVCEKIGIEHYVFDLREEFSKKVIDNFKCEYMCGKTPNPCVECNKYIKFGELFKYARKLNCNYLATGHYAKVVYSNKYNQFVLTKSKNEVKDQTYFLYGIDKNILPNLLFPLADFESKEEIREIAKRNGLEVASKKDSQEICFIPNNDYVDFLMSDNMFKTQKSGDIVLKDGTIVGKHKGLIHYTIGQRKGLGIAYKEPLYVLKLDIKNNVVIVGEEKDLYSNVLYADNLNFLLNIDFKGKLDVKAKIRYRAKEAEAKLSFVNISELDTKAKEKQDEKNVIEVKKKKINEEEHYIIKSENNINGNQNLKNKIVAKLEFKEPQRAITPGQSVVFYLEDLLLGGGKII